MMKFARVISLILALLLVVGIFTSCKGSKPSGNNSSSTTSTSSETEGESNGDFDDSDGDETNDVIPGEDTQDDNDVDDSIDDDNYDGDNYDGETNDSDDDDADAVVSESMLDNKDVLLYYYETDYYAYAITEGGQEVFAFKEKDGSYLDVLAGGGKVALYSDSTQIMGATDVLTYERSFVNGAVSLTVTYLYYGIYEKEPWKNMAQVTYFFYNEYVDVSYRVVYNSSVTISCSSDDFYRSCIQREFYMDYESVKKNMATKWVYPEDCDAPYSLVKAWATTHTFDDTHAIYTFNYGNAPEKFRGVYLDRYYPDVNVPLFANIDRNATSIDFTAKYVMVFSNTEDKAKADYRALGMADRANYAAGISAITKNDDNSTLFVKDKVDLNLNITNLTNSDIEVDVRYDIRDYYGNIIDSGIYLGSTVFGGLDANRKISIDAKKHGYGMYFVNFKVYTKKYIFYDYYPLILIKDSSYPERNKFPFGIAQVKENEICSVTDQASLLIKIGAGYIRSMPTTIADEDDIRLEKAAIERLQQAGMKITSFNFLWTAFNKPEADPIYRIYGSYFDYLLVRNEVNMEINEKLPNASTGGIENAPQALVDSVWNTYVSESLNDQKRICREKGYTMIYAGISAGPRYWYEKIYRSGDWNTSSVLAVHGYAGNHSIPDAKEETEANGMWAFEATLVRTKKAIKEFGKNGFKKRWFVNECGCSSSVLASNKSFVDPRTKGDYDIRYLILSDAYGAEYSELYCLLDYANGGVGTVLDDREWGFGAFHFPDFFGRFKPKPTANAFITLSTTLGGVKSSTESSKYSNGVSQRGGTLRVFDFTTVSKGHVFVAWSNCKRQVNDTTIVGSGIQGTPRNPQLPWNHNWTVTENLVVDSRNDYVTVVRTGGKTEKYKVRSGKATIPIDGSVSYIIGAY